MRCPWCSEMEKGQKRSLVPPAATSGGVEGVKPLGGGCEAHFTGPADRPVYGSGAVRASSLHVAFQGQRPQRRKQG